MIIGTVPQIGVNDETALLLEWTKEPQQHVRQGEVLGVLETTKAVSDIEAEEEGYFQPVAASGDRVAVGGLLYILTDTPDEPIEAVVRQFEAGVNGVASDGVNEIRSHTKKAELLAKQHGINIDDVHAVGVVRESDVEQFIRNRVDQTKVNDLIDDVFVTNRAERILVIGGGRGCVQVLDIIHASPCQRAVGILDDSFRICGKMIMGVEVLGQISDAVALFEDSKFDSAVVSFSNDLPARARIFQELRSRGIPFANVIDQTVRIHTNVILGTGNVVIANSRLGSCARVGNNNFLSAYVNIEHHNVLGSHCTFGPGVMTSSRVTIRDRSRFGTGVFIEPGVTIGEDVIVASGAIITSNIPRNNIVKTRVETLVRPR